jgi:hypothetical protein
VTLTFPTVPANPAPNSFARFRLSTDAAAADPTGRASDGEVEDYPAKFSVNDTEPDPFAFVDQTNVALSSPITSAAITVTGINAPTPISVTGGTYSINNGAFTAAAGNVSNNDKVRVRHTSAATPNTQVNTTLNIGGVSDTFTSTTTSTVPDTEPNPFAFVDQTNVAPNLPITSAAITVTGINAPAPISVTGGTYSINGGAFTSAAGNVSNGNTVRVRHTSAATPSTPVNTTLNIGGVSDTFTSTTAASGGGGNEIFSDQFE